MQGDTARCGLLFGLLLAEGKITGEVAANQPRKLEKPFLGGNSARFYLELPLASGRLQARQAPSTSKKQTPLGWLKQAIANWRTVQKTLRQMQRLSRQEVFQSVPGPKRRKKLSKTVLGLV